MAKEQTSFDITSVASIKKKAPSGIKGAIGDIIKTVNVGEFFGDSKWNKTKSTTVSGAWKIKVSGAGLKKIKKYLKPGRAIKGTLWETYEAEEKSLSGKAVLDIMINGYGIRFRESGLTSATKGKADGKTTAMQENASKWVIERAINDNKRYGKWQDIPNDGKYRELVAIYPQIDDIWLKALWAQNNKMFQLYASASFSQFSREGGFMGFITKTIKDKFGISRKDNWNPADIWMVQNQSDREKELEKACEGTHPTIIEFNNVMKNQFKNKQVVGVSLKKISGKVAKWQEINVGDVMLKADDFRYELDSAKCTLTVGEGRGGEGRFSTQDTIVVVKDKTGKFKFQVKNSGGSGVGNQKVEGTVVGSSAARAGKAPQEFLRPLFRDDYKMSFTNRWNEYPLTYEEFESEFDKHWKRFTTIHSKINSGIKNTKEAFRKSFKESWDDKKGGKDVTQGIATGKLMQLHFLSELFAMQTKKREDLLTDLVFLSQKIGPRFGPFGKLY